MEKKTKDFILNTLHQGKDYSDEGTADYSGRTLFGKKTHAVVIEERESIQEATMELLNCDDITIDEILYSGLICESCNDSDIDFQHNDIKYVFKLKIDSFGRGFIFH